MGQIKLGLPLEYNKLSEHDNSIFFIYTTEDDLTNLKDKLGKLSESGQISLSADNTIRNEALSAPSCCVNSSSPSAGRAPSAPAQRPSPTPWCCPVRTAWLSWLACRYGPAWTPNSPQGRNMAVPAAGGRGGRI